MLLPPKALVSIPIFDPVARRATPTLSSRSPIDVGRIAPSAKSHCRDKRSGAVVAISAPDASLRFDLAGVFVV